MDFKKKLRTNSYMRSAREKFFSINSITNSPYKSLINNIEKLDLKFVFDVGANVGQFGLDLRRYGYSHQIISFEPVSETFAVLSETIKKHQPWNAVKLGLGSSESEQNINISANDGLSTSFLAMQNLHFSNFPNSKVIATEKVLISTLDRQIKSMKVDPQTMLLKMDVQGYEYEVLKGASESISKIPLCYLEVSLQPLYKGERTLLPLLNMLSSSGHEVIDVYRGIRAKNGDLLQLDILTRLSNIQKI